MNKDDYIIGWEKFSTSVDVWKKDERGNYQRKHKIDNTGQVWDEDSKLDDGVSEEDVKKRYDKTQYMDENELTSTYFEDFLNDHKKIRRLNAKWTVELEQDLKNMHGIDIDKELMTAMSHEIEKDIDNNIINTMKSMAENMPAITIEFEKINVS